MQVSKSEDGKVTLGGARSRIVEDFSPGDFETRKKALPLMKKAYDEGKKGRFTRGKLWVAGI